MLTILIPKVEMFDERTERFVDLPAVVVKLEHSLVSLSKWESKHQKPFLTDIKKTHEEILDYVRAMIVKPREVPNDLLERFTSDHFLVINEYIESKQTATTFREEPKKKGLSETITSELVYYWMIAYDVPFECQYWHLNRLLTLIRVCDVKRSKPKRLSHKELAARNRSLNEQRKAALGTKG